MKILNKNGFTLVELLAVIVVLAVIMLLAVNAVLPQMTTARKNAFVTETESYFNAVDSWYNYELLNGTVPTNCVKLETLKGEYVDAPEEDVGYITIEQDVTNDGNIYKIWISNGDYSISGKTQAEIAEGVSALDENHTAPTIPSTCE